MTDNRHTAPRRSPLRRLGLVTAPLLLAGLAACAAPFNADVKRFASQLPAPTGQSYAIIADDPRDEGGLEFGQYADFVAAEMSRIGYVRTDPGNAALLVRFDYDVDKGRERVRNTGFRDPFWDPWYGRSFGYSRLGYGGYGRRGWGYGWHDPFFYGGYGGGIDVTTVYTSGIDLKIDRKADGQRLFEGRAEAASTSDRLGYLVPNLVEAMFTDFPGRSGETVRISIAPEKTTVRRID